MLACDFFTVDTVFARLCVLFFIELGSRRVHVAGCTRHPSGAWVAQQARQLAWSLADRASPPRFLIHDRDSKFSRAFDEIFRSQGIEIVRTPIHAPQANAYAERFVGTVRRECLDWILIASRRQLERILSVYVDHYTAIVRIAVSGSSHRSRDPVSAQLILPIRSASADAIVSVDSFTNTAQPREPDRVCAPHRLITATDNLMKLHKHQLAAARA